MTSIFLTPTNRMRLTTYFSKASREWRGPGREIAPAFLALTPLALCRIFMALTWTLFSLAGQSEPYTPSADNEILERLPVREGPLWQAIPLLRSKRDARPDDVAVAAELARTYHRLYQQTGDARLLGYAEATVEPWWNLSDAPIEVALVRAELRQTAHEFVIATAELREIVRRDPQRAEAWLQLAAVTQVQGDYEAARRACTRLVATADPQIAGACLAASNAATGRATAALDYLDQVLFRSDSTALSAGEASMLIWMHTLAGDIAASLGRNGEAEEHFRTGIGLASQNGGKPGLYLLVAYADLLIDERRDREVLIVLQPVNTADTALLRIARAEVRLGMATGQTHRDELIARLAAMQARGDRVHGREQAYLALYLTHDAGRALAFAQSNWQVQREAIDSRLLLEAAAAAGSPAAATAVHTWLKALGTDDIRLTGKSSGDRAID